MGCCPPRTTKSSQPRRNARRRDDGGPHDAGLNRLPPATGTRVEQGQPFGEVESTKSVSDLYAPVSGTIVERNESLESNPELVNTDPYGEGWMVVIEADDPGALDGLLSAEDYEKLTAAS